MGWGRLLTASRWRLPAVAPKSLPGWATEGKLSARPAAGRAKPASDRGHPQAPRRPLASSPPPPRGLPDRLPRAGPATAAPLRGGGRNRVSPGSARPAQPRLLPLRTLPALRSPATGGMDVCSATPPGSVTWSSRRPLHVRGARCRPRRRRQPRPRMLRSAPLRSGGKNWGPPRRRRRRQLRCAPPRAQAAINPLPPGAGAEAPSPVRAAGEEGRQETPGHRGAGVFIPSCLRPPGPPLPRSAGPNAASPRRPPGGFGGNGTEPSVPRGRSAPPAPAPPLASPGGSRGPSAGECPLLRPAPRRSAPLLSAPHRAASPRQARGQSFPARPGSAPPV